MDWFYPVFCGIFRGIPDRFPDADEIPLPEEQTTWTADTRPERFPALVE